MRIPDSMNIADFPPMEVIRAAQTIVKWAEMRQFRDWQIMGIGPVKKDLEPSVRLAINALEMIGSYVHCDVIQLRALANMNANLIRREAKLSSPHESRDDSEFDYGL